MGKALISINHQPSGGKEWVAEITGRDQKYGVARRFLTAINRNWSSSGKTGITTYELEEGRLYQVKPSWKDRYYAAVSGQGIVIIGTSAVQEALERLDQGLTAFPTNEEVPLLNKAVEEGILRVNGEGGIISRTT